MAFYCFTLEDIEHQSNQKWCWCACINWIVNEFGINTNYKEQWQILYYFIRYVSDKEYPSLKWKKEYIDRKFYNESIHIDFMPKLLKSFFNEKITFNEIRVDKILNSEAKKEIVRKKLSYENIKKELKKNKAPYIIWIRSHVMLINGYGKIGDCNYFLLSDPNKKEYYYKNSQYFDNNYLDILGIWTLKSQNGLELIKDSEIDDLLEIYYEIDINRYNSKIKSPIDLINLNEKINIDLFNHDNNDSLNLKASIISTIKNYDSEGKCIYRMTKPKDITRKFYQKTEIENTLKVINSYLKSNGKDIELNNIKFYDYKSHTDKNEITLFDKNNQLKILIQGELMDFNNVIGQIKMNKIISNN